MGPPYPCPSSSPLLPAPETAAPTPAPGESKGSAGLGEFSSGQEGPHPTPSLQEQPLTLRACRSALITSSISLQITDQKWGRGCSLRAWGWGLAGSQPRDWVGSRQDLGALG